MSVYGNSVANQIKDQIISKIDDLSSIKKVYPSEKVTSEGWPAVFVKSADLQGEFSSNAENSRVYGYRITAAFPTGQDFIPESERERMDYSERVLNGVLDDIINTIDTDFELDGTPVLYVEAADAEWGFIQIEGGIAEALQVTLKVYTEKVVV